MDNPAAGLNLGSDTTYFTVVDKDGNAVSFINSLFDSFGSGVVAGDTGIALHNRGNGFSLDPNHLNRLEPGKRPFHTLIPAMVFKDDRLFLSFGVMGGAIQAQGHVQVLSSLIDRKLGLQEAIDAPRFRFTEGKSVLLEDELGSSTIDSLIGRGHECSKSYLEPSVGIRQDSAEPLRITYVGAGSSLQNGDVPAARLLIENVSGRDVNNFSVNYISGWRHSRVRGSGAIQSDLDSRGSVLHPGESTTLEVNPTQGQLYWVWLSSVEFVDGDNWNNAPYSTFIPQY